jgi:hypothetical protein
MSFVNFSPLWFLGYDILLELLFFVITLIISVFAFKIYKKTFQKNVLLFASGFLLISLSYLVQSLFNFLALSKLNENICIVININSVLFFNFLGTITHIFFMIFGLSVLTYITLKIERKRAFLLILLLPSLGLIFSRDLISAFFMYSSLLLSFLSYHFIMNYLKKKDYKSLLIALSFILLFLGNINFIFLPNNSLFYALGHFVNLIAYILIIINFYLVLKK